MVVFQPSKCKRKHFRSLLLVSNFMFQFVFFTIFKSRIFQISGFTLLQFTYYWDWNWNWNWNALFHVDKIVEKKNQINERIIQVLLISIDMSN